MRATTPACSYNMRMHDGAFWLQRWTEGRTGWHLDDVHPALPKHWRIADGQDLVLVPMCGKSIDLRWLAERGHRVLGVELAEQAVQEFFREQQLPYTIDSRPHPDKPTAWRANELPITVHCGDYFALVGVRCGAHYDRGALVAMPADVRADYARHTSSLLLPNAEQLVVTLEYCQDAVNGPPWAVTEDELLSYWPQLTCVERREVLDEVPPKFRDAGLDSVIEAVWRSPAR